MKVVFRRLCLAQLISPAYTNQKLKSNRSINKAKQPQTFSAKISQEISFACQIQIKTSKSVSIVVSKSFGETRAPPLKRYVAVVAGSAVSDYPDMILFWLHPQSGPNWVVVHQLAPNKHGPEGGHLSGHHGAPGRCYRS